MVNLGFSFGVDEEGGLEGIEGQVAEENALPKPRADGEPVQQVSRWNKYWGIMVGAAVMLLLPVGMMGTKEE